MPEDVRFPFEYDEAGDVATVEGQRFYENHALQLSLIGIEQIRGGPLTANGLVEIQSRIERTFRQSPYFQAPSVTIEDVDAQAETVTIGVQAGNVTQFTIPVDLPDTEAA